MSDTYSALGFEIDPSRLSKNELNAIRVSLGVSAALAIILGILLLVWPDSSVAVAAFLFGLYFLIVGIVRLAKGIFSKGISGGARTINIILGVLLVVAGIFAMKNLGTTAVFLGLIVGVAWIIEGVAALVESSAGSARWMGIVFGVISVIAGIVVLLLPLESIVLLVWVGGIFLIVAGLAQLVQAFTFGRGAAAS